jgi:hypothetical protein
MSRPDFDAEAFREFSLCDCLSSAIRTSDPELQSPALICLAELFRSFTLCPVELLIVVVELFGATEEDDVIVNCLLFFEQAMRPEVIVLFHEKEVWQSVLHEFSGRPFDVKVASMRFMFRFLELVELSLLLEMINRSLFDWFVTVFGDGRKRKASLKAFAVVLARIRTAPQEVLARCSTDEGEMFTVALELAIQLCESLPDCPESTDFFTQFMDFRREAVDSENV